MSRTPEETLRIFDEGGKSSSKDLAYALEEAIRQRDDLQKIIEGGTTAYREEADWHKSRCDAALAKLEVALARMDEAREYADAIFQSGMSKGIGFCIQVAGLARQALAKIESMK